MPPPIRNSGLRAGLGRSGRSADIVQTARGAVARDARGQARALHGKDSISAVGDVVPTQPPCIPARAPPRPIPPPIQDA
eukprot:2843205-Pyramimonas_sp.AAC.1